MEISRQPLICQCEHEDHLATPAGQHGYQKAAAAAMVDTVFGVWPLCRACVEARHGDLGEGMTYRVEWLGVAS